ncbi:Retrovirus-related Pol polyprotein from transposon TNT 1-94 [Linum perenne]
METGRILGCGEVCDGLYVLKGSDQVEVPPRDDQKHANIVASLDSFDNKVFLWHFRLGHPSFLYLERLFPELFINQRANQFQCEVCQLAKHTRTVYSGLKYQPTKPFAVVHSDIWGPMKTQNVNGARWFVTFIDDHTRLTWTFLMKEKSETTTIFQNFHRMVSTQFQTTIQVLKTDNAHDYFNSALGSYLTTHGIIHASSCVDTPQQNGIAERKNRHLLEVARASMFSHSVPKYLWGEAVLTATYLINRLPSRVLNFRTPRQVFLDIFPHISRYSPDLPPKVFGCTVFIHIAPQHRSKLDPRSMKGVFIGYSATQKGYKCYVPHKKRVYTTRDVTFFEALPYFNKTVLQGEQIPSESSTESVESQFVDLIALEDDSPWITTMAPVQGESSSRPQKPLVVYQRRKTTAAVEEVVRDQAINPENPDIHEQDVEVVVDDETNDLDLPIALRKGVRNCTRYPISNQVSYERLSESHKAFIMTLDQIVTPKNIQEAMESPEWKKAVMEELNALEKNGTWDVVPLPTGKNTVDCKWLFTVKYRADGAVERFKARLVARGFTQSYGVDYEETFAPVAKLNTIKILLSLVVNLDWPLHQLDVKNAFLNGDLAEEVYMNLPPGIRKPRPDLVCKLRKALYGLKQSPRAWFERFTNAVKKGGYYQCQTDHTLFVKHSSTGRMSILIVYVDDIIITGDDVEEIQNLKAQLATEFEIKDLGNLKYFLGMEVSRSANGIVISQRKYVLDLLKETGMLDCKPIDTPMEANKQLSKKEDIPSVDKGSYQRLVGRLIYLAHTRPDIAFAVSIVSQHMHNPNEEHWEMVTRILRYLKHSPGKGIHFKKTTQRSITVYTDASWAGELTDRKSTTGYCSFIWGNLVTWRSKKQNVVARSSAEAEYRALALGICESIWLKRVLTELRVKYEEPIQFLCDSQAAISIVKNPVHHDRTKYVEVDRHFITDTVAAGTVQVYYVSSKQQTADILTKALPKDVFEFLTSKLGLINIYTKLEGEC